MSASRFDTPLWPSRLKEACAALQAGGSGAGLRKAQGEAWQLMNLALTIYLRSHAKRMGDVSFDDLEDLAAEKSLDLMNRVSAGKTDFSGRAPSEIMSFFSKVAKNELLGHLKRQGRFVIPGDDDDGRGLDMSAAVGKTAGDLGDSADLAIERKEFASALLECAKALKSRSRTVWLFRVFYNMASKDIALHPRVGLEASHVDVLLQRCRGEISACMGLKGYSGSDMPPGVFAVLWQCFKGAELSPKPTPPS